MSISDTYQPKIVAKTTISIKVNQKRVFDKLQQEFSLDNQTKLNTNQFFGYLLTYFQEHVGCKNHNKAERLIKSMGETPVLSDREEHEEKYKK